MIVGKTCLMKKDSMWIFITASLLVLRRFKIAKYEKAGSPNKGEPVFSYVQRVKVEPVYSI